MFVWPMEWFNCPPSCDTGDTKTVTVDLLNDTDTSDDNEVFYLELYKSKKDAESGNEGESVARELFALNAMYERGLIPEAEYQARKAELEAAGKSDA